MTHADSGDADGTHADDTHADDAGKTSETGNADEAASSPEDTEDASAQPLSWMDAMRQDVNRPGITDNTSRTIEGTLGTFFQDYVHLLVDKPEDVDPRTIREYLGRTSISDAYRLSLYSRLNAFYQWLVDAGHIRSGQNPMQDIERPEPPSVERPYLSPEEFAELTYAIEVDYERRSQMEGRKGI